MPPTDHQTASHLWITALNTPQLAVEQDLLRQLDHACAELQPDFWEKGAQIFLHPFGAIPCTAPQPLAAVTRQERQNDAQPVPSPARPLGVGGSAALLFASSAARPPKQRMAFPTSADLEREITHGEGLRERAYTQCGDSAGFCAVMVLCASEKEDCKGTICERSLGGR